jgi:hypothetical protein
MIREPLDTTKHAWLKKGVIFPTCVFSTDFFSNFLYIRIFLCGFSSWYEFSNERENHFHFPHMILINIFVVVESFLVLGLFFEYHFFGKFFRIQILVEFFWVFPPNLSDLTYVNITIEKLKMKGIESIVL